MLARTIRDCIALAALGLTALGYDRMQRSSRAERTQRSERAAAADHRNVILVVSDGMRWQEVFRGADSVLVFGDAAALGGDPAAVKRKFWRPTLAERRRALMPFVWNTLAREGQLLGNRDLGSRMNVTNGLNFSYPGYNEMLVGRPDARIDRNDYGPNPNVTVFEWLNGREEFHGKVEAIGAWTTFDDIFNRRRSGIRVHTGQLPPMDKRAHANAMRILKERHPRALFVAYVETDDHAHRGRYDRTLDAAHAVDAYLAELWAAAQADPTYRGRTTLIFTADHGRGAASTDWTDHGREVRGAEEVFVALLGPGIAGSGEGRNTPVVTESQVAATVAAALRLQYHREAPSVGQPLFTLPR
jgi:hypothetical protein